MMDGHPFRQEGLIAKGNFPRQAPYPTKYPTGRHRPFATATPPAFRDALLAMARSVSSAPRRA